MGFIVVPGAIVEPITLEEARLNILLDNTDRDASVLAAITDARIFCEKNIERKIAEQTIELALDEFPAGAIELPCSPASSIVSIKYIDKSGVEQTLSPSAYTLDPYSHLSWAIPAYWTEWPETLSAANVVKVRYVVGKSTCDGSLRRAMLILITYFFDDPLALKPIPDAVYSLLDQERAY